MTQLVQAKTKLARAYRHMLVARVILEEGKTSANGNVDRACIDHAAHYLDHASKGVESVAIELGMDTEWWTAFGKSTWPISAVYFGPPLSC